MRTFWSLGQLILRMHTQGSITFGTIYEFLSIWHCDSVTLCIGIAYSSILNMAADHSFTHNTWWRHEMHFMVNPSRRWFSAVILGTHPNSAETIRNENRNLISTRWIALSRYKNSLKGPPHPRFRVLLRRNSRNVRVSLLFHSCMNSHSLRLRRFFPHVLQSPFIE